ncbi:MAG: GNAT family N-acetyltransferase [Chitinophagaceae bacterium]|nr:GNAT family N-acetyltransferase [Oligoflexus sp.]
MKFKILKSIYDIGLETWRKLESPDFPFNDFEFFAALEDSGSIGKESGWHPVYLACSDETKGDVIVGILYSFVKQHSYGEYIFDWQWANFFQAHGIPYYPKLLTAVPFTPATGPRILVNSQCTDESAVRSLLIKAALQIATNSEMSSYHALFIEESEAPSFEAEGLAVRHSIQYHWHNRGYKDFQEFLNSLVGKRRRDIVRERSRANSHGLTIECLTGASLKPQHGAVMEALYQTTTDKKNAIAYLQTGFFERIFTRMADRIVLVLASKDGVPVAGALNFRKGKKLYGRYWGSFHSYQDLHFELCYYQTIDYAIQHGIEVFEAGAQGEHKIQRGFLPSLTWSAHKVFDRRFALPIEAFIKEEKAAIAAELRAMTGPYKVTGN